MKYKTTLIKEVGQIGILNTSDASPIMLKEEHIEDKNYLGIVCKPGSEAKVGDTVYCIRDTGGDCKVHDLFIISKTTKDCISPVDNHKLLNGELTKANWTWWRTYFVVLTKIDSQSEFPCFRQSISDKHIVRFTSTREGTVVHVGDSSYPLHYSSNGWLEYDRTDVWTPCEDPSNQKEVDTIQDLIESIPNNIVPTVIAVDSMMDKPTQTKPNTKGKQMNSSLFTDMLKLLTQIEQTDLQKAPSTYAFFYNEDGEYEGTAKVANEAEAKALLQRPEHLGYTMRIYSFSDEFTTQIPVVSTIKKTVAAKPAIKPRKPRTPKAN